jgi:hypothetical protein
MVIGNARFGSFIGGVGIQRKLPDVLEPQVLSEVIRKPDIYSLDLSKRPSPGLAANVAHQAYASNMLPDRLHGNGNGNGSKYSSYSSYSSLIPPNNKGLLVRSIACV